MKKLPSLARALAFVSLAALLAGCKTAVAERGHGRAFRATIACATRSRCARGKQTLTVFIGDRRGGLTPSQRAEVGALAPAWRREATGGFVIEMPVGARERARRDERRARNPRDARRRRRAAARRSRSGPIAPTIRPGSAPSASTIRGWRRRPARAGCGRRISARPTIAVYIGEPPALESRLRQPAQSRRAGRQPGRPGAAARRNAGARLAPRDRRSTSTARAKPTATQYPDANKGKISDVGQ